MEPVSRNTPLAANGARRRVVRGEDGDVHLSWGSWSVGMSVGEFVDFAGTLAEAAERPMRCGEVARGCCGRVVCCSMGQILVSHGNLTLWFSPEEFEGLQSLTATARGRLADAEPMPAFGVPWNPAQDLPSAN